MNFLPKMSDKTFQIVMITLSMVLSACNYSQEDNDVNVLPKGRPNDATDGTQFIAIVNESPESNLIELSARDLAIVDQQVKLAVIEYNIKREQQLKEFELQDPKYTFPRHSYLIDVNRYKRQYVVSLNERNQKEVWVNCFCSSPDNDGWKSQIVSVRDGGSCYFNLKVNLQQKRYYEFVVNSRA